MTVRDTREMFARIRLARRLRAEMEEREGELKELKARIISDFDAEGLDRILVDEVPCTVVKAAERRLDIARLKKEAPDVYERYVAAPVERVSVRL